MNTAKITVNGKEYSLLFGYTCYKLFIARCFRFRDTYLTEAGELTGLGIANLFHSAYLNYCYDKQIDPALSYDDIAEWMDGKYESKEGQEQLLELLEVWAKSKEIKKLAEDEKKNQTQTQPQTSTQ